MNLEIHQELFELNIFSSVHPKAFQVFHKLCKALTKNCFVYKDSIQEIKFDAKILHHSKVESNLSICI